MKKLLLAALLAIGASTVSFAQGFQQRTPDEQVAQLKTQVPGITDAQSAKLKTVFEGAVKTRDSLFQAAQGGGGDMSAMRGAFTKMQDAQTAKIKAVLTAEQLPAYQKVLDAAAERRKQFQQQQGGN